MLRFPGAGAVLLAMLFLFTAATASAAPSTAAAGAHYVEVWNPPEARVGHPKAAVKSRTKLGKAAPHRIADRLAKASTARHAAIYAAKKNASPTASPRFTDIPRIVTPEGNVLQVGTGRTAASVVR